MRHLQLAELRGAWLSWLGVSLAFVVSNFALVLSALALVSGQRALRAGAIDPLDAGAYVFLPTMNLIFSGLMGAVVIGTATAMVLNARRGALARLALSGATPRQIAVTVVVQLSVVSLACSVVGSVLALLALKPALSFLADERLEAGTPMLGLIPIYSPWPILAASLLAIGVALVGGLRQIRAGSRIAPVEALREHARDGREIRMTLWRWIGLGLAVLAVVVGYAALAVLTMEPNQEVLNNLMMLSISMLVIASAPLALLAPIIVGPLTRAWSSLIPARSASWELARRTVSARATRLTRSVVPVMMTIGLLLGILTQFGVIQGTVIANGLDVDLSASGAATLLLFLGLPLAIALAGGVGSLIMMSRQRDAELALLGIVGATPRQRIIMPALEALIITVTALLMSLVMVAVAVGILVIGMPLAGYRFGVIVPWGMSSAVLSVALIITMAATVLPTLRAWQRAEPGVIARFVAE